MIDGKTLFPGQVNNEYVFPGVAFGAISCKATTLPDAAFLAAAEAVALSLTDQEIVEQRVVPNPMRMRDVSANVATAVVLACDKAGVATRKVGGTREEVHSALVASMWRPNL